MSECTVTFKSHNKRVTVNEGTTLLEAAAKADIVINNVCGGDGICGRCKMIIRDGKVSGGTSAKLTRDEIKEGVVLSCLTIIESDCIVDIPEETLVQIGKAGREDTERFRDFGDILGRGTCTPNPLVRKIYLDLEEPSLSKNIPDHQRVCTEVKRKLDVSATQTGLKIIKSLPKILREHNYQVTAAVGMRTNFAEVMYIEGGNTEDKNYLAIVDMGTTTVVAHLVDGTTLKTLDAQACFNSQGIYGREVTGRLISAEKKGIEHLQRPLVNDINQLVQDLAENNDITITDITAIVCAGNTAMGHFLLGLPVEHIRRTPYIATSVEPPPLRAAEVGIKINPRGLLYSLPGISGWVGSDLTAGIFATGMHESSDISLLVDIGTNGEVIIGNNEWLMACSASAGPALEGASVECGMRAEKGAIEKVYAQDGIIQIETIGNGEPRGICGSGIIDLLSVLLQEEIVNRSGKFIEKGSKRIKTKDGIKRYIMVEKNKTNKQIYITEADIENIITAKAAIYAAMKILLQRLDLDFTDIKHFYLAGAFGKHIDIDNAVTIGLIPNISRDRVEFVGNTSIKGAKMVALCHNALDTIIEIGKNTTYYDLMGANDYVQEFTKAMFLPHTDIETFQKILT